jgi:hypothetical protein
MNRFAAIIALTTVVLGVSIATSFSTAASLAFATALVAGAMLVHEFAFSLETSGRGSARISHVREFLASVVSHTIRFSIAALAIAWTVVSLQWYAGS